MVVVVIVCGGGGGRAEPSNDETSHVSDGGWSTVPTSRKIARKIARTTKVPIVEDASRGKPTLFWSLQVNKCVVKYNKFCSQMTSPY